MGRNGTCYQRGVCLLYGETLRGIGGGFVFQMRGKLVIQYYTRLGLPCDTKLTYK